MTANDYVTVSAAFKLSAADLASLESSEGVWLAQAQGSPQFDDIAASEWQQWIQGSTPEYRLVAYANNFVGSPVGKPVVLDIVGDYQPDVHGLLALEKAAEASTGNQPAGMGAGILAAAAIGLWLFLGRKK